MFMGNMSTDASIPREYLQSRNNSYLRNKVSGNESRMMTGDSYGNAGFWS